VVSTSEPELRRFGDTSEYAMPMCVSALTVDTESTRRISRNQTSTSRVKLYSGNKTMYCDMTPESQKCAVRETPQRRPLLDNGSLGTLPQQRISTK
jgi:hypothetical protein